MFLASPKSTSKITALTRYGATALRRYGAAALRATALRRYGATARTRYALCAMRHGRDALTYRSFLCHIPLTQLSRSQRTDSAVAEPRQQQPWPVVGTLPDGKRYRHVRLRPDSFDRG